MSKSESYNELLREYANLMEKKDKLSEEKDKLSEEYNGLSEKYDELSEESKSKRTKLDKLLSFLVGITISYEITSVVFYHLGVFE